MRQRFWILSGRSVHSIVTYVLFVDYTMQKVSKPFLYQSLPEHRVRDAAVFEIT